MKDLFNYERHRRRQAAVDARYGYPLLSTSNFQDWVRFGGEAPSPQEWCNEYATRTVQPHAFHGR